MLTLSNMFHLYRSYSYQYQFSTITNLLNLLCLIQCFIHLLNQYYFYELLILVFLILFTMLKHDPDFLHQYHLYHFIRYIISVFIRQLILYVSLPQYIRTQLILYCHYKEITQEFPIMLIMIFLIP